MTTKTEAALEHAIAFLRRASEAGRFASVEVRINNEFDSVAVTVHQGDPSIVPPDAVHDEHDGAYWAAWKEGGVTWTFFKEDEVTS